jgi:chemotaxis protein MotA
MTVILGVLGVVLSVLIGFMGPGGPVEVLFQPYEYLVITGGIGFTVLISQPIPVLKALPAGFMAAIKGSGITAAVYKDLLGLMATIFDTMRREGVLGIEGDISNPHQSARFNKYPKASHNHHLMETFTSALRLYVDGVVNAFDLDKMLDSEIETHHEEGLLPSTAVKTMADSFPAMGIVAAVLGIIITMQYLDGPPTEIGHHVAAALVGTMLGIFLSDGFVGPIGTKMEHVVRENTSLLKCVRAGLVAFAGGAPPAVALEFARKTIPSCFRPTAEQLEEIIKDAKKK